MTTVPPTVPLRRRTAASALAAAVLLLAAAPARAADVPGTVDSVQVQGDQVQFVLTAPTRTAPGGAVAVDDVAVTVGGQPATTRSVVTSGDQVERRLLLLIDVSGSMRSGGMAAAQSAAGTLVRTVAPDVEVGLAVFDDDARVLVPPTADRQAVLDAIGALTAQEETALYDGVAAAVEALGSTGDRTLVLLSDGGDTVSVRTLQSTEQLLAQSGVRAQVVGFRTDESQDGVLQSLAAAGRGSVTTAQDAAGLTQAFSAVATVLSSQVQVVATLPPGAGGEQTVRVEADLGPDRVVAESTVLLPAVAADEPSAAPAPAPRADATVVAGALPFLLRTPWPAVVLVAVVAAAALLLLLGGRRREDAPVSRLDQIAFYSVAGREVPQPVPAVETSRARPVAEAAEAFVRRRGLEDGLALLLDRADLPWKPYEYVLLRLAAAAAATAVAVVLGAAWPLVVLAPFVGWFALTAVVHQRARRRVAQFARQLPDALALVGAGLQSGFSLGQALDAVAKDSAEPLRGQLTRAMAENRLGADIEDALDRVADRMSCEDLGWTVMAVRIQRQVGGNLSRTLRTTVETLRERASLRRQVAALSADGRMSAYVLLALPPLLGVGLAVFRSDYIGLLWSRPVGLLMIAIGVVGMVIGAFWISRLVRVEL